MSEQLEPTTANFNASDVAALSPETRATFADIMAKHGHNPEAVKAKLTAAPTPAPAPTPSLSDHQAVALDHPDNSLSPADRAAAIEALRKVGVSEEDIQSALNHRPTATSGMSGRDYRLSYVEHAQRMTTQELAKFDGEIRNGFAAAGVSSEHAQGLVDAILNTSSDYAAFDSEAELKFHRASDMSALTKMSNSDEIIRTAKIAYNALPADFRAKLDAKHAFDSLEAYVALSRICQALEYKKSKRG